MRTVTILIHGITIIISKVPTVHVIHKPIIIIINPITRNFSRVRPHISH